jgi:hypothetical protein
MQLFAPVSSWVCMLLASRDVQHGVSDTSFHAVVGVVQHIICDPATAQTARHDTYVPSLWATPREVNLHFITLHMHMLT